MHDPDLHAPDLHAPDPHAHVQVALAEPFRRVRPVVLPDGRRFWLKRVERLPPLDWLDRFLARIKPDSRELRAVGLTLRRLRHR